MPDDVVQVASDNPVVLRILAITLIVLAVLSGVEKIGGKVGALLSKWTTSRRRTADGAKAAGRRNDDVERETMRRQIDYLMKRSEERDRRDAERDRQDAEWDRVLFTHQGWDRRAVQETDAGSKLGPPPPLWPIETTPPLTP